ncbi:MAG: hypothetical protein GC168_14005 [Candidatus Hydrogenedens sp.]|nr:hypothetical protein [Candidatus Hydrogenedens sp.]
MHRGTWFRVALVGVAFFLFSPSSQAGVIFIDSLEDPGIPGDGQTTLREAIIAANTDTATDSGGTGNGADVIDLSGLGGILALNGPLPDVVAELEIVGQPQLAVTISGGNLHAFMANSGPGLRLANLIFEDAYFCAAPFGAIRNSGTLLIENCIIRGGRAALRTGVVNEASGTLEIRSTRFEDNIATPDINEIGFGGNSGRWLNSGAVLTNEGNALMVDCEVVDNHSWIVGVIQNFGHLVVEHCHFLDNGGANLRYNPATGVEPETRYDVGIARGAVIHSGFLGLGAGQSLRVRDSHFEGNLTAAIESFSSVLEVTRSSFYANRGDALRAVADSGLISNSTFLGHDASRLRADTPVNRYGNGIALTGEITLVHCTILGAHLSVGGSSSEVGEGPAKILLKNTIVNAIAMKDEYIQRGGSSGYWGFTVGKVPSETLEEAYQVFDLRAGFEAFASEALNGTLFVPVKACGPAHGTGVAVNLTLPDFPGALDTDQNGTLRTGVGAPDIGAHQSTAGCSGGLPPQSDAVCALPDLEQHTGLVVNSLADPGAPGDGLVTLREAIIAYYLGLETDLGQDGASADYMDLTCLSGRLLLHYMLPPFTRSFEIRGPEDQSLTISSGLSSMPTLLGLGYPLNATEELMTGIFENLVFEGLRTSSAAIESGWLISRIEFRHCKFTRCTTVYAGLQAAFFDSAIVECQYPLYPVNDLEFVRSLFRGNTRGIGAGRLRADVSVFDSNLETPVVLPWSEYLSTINRCLFTNNHGTMAGALAVLGNIDVTNSTFSGNRFEGGYYSDGQFLQITNGGGAINVLPHYPAFDDTPFTARFTHCTIVGNRSARRGGGIFNMDPTAAGKPDDAARVVLRNSIVAGNAARLDGQDVSGKVIANTYNVIGNPAGASGLGATDRTGYAMEEIIAPLENYGGPHRTHAVLRCGPAFDYCPVVGGVTLDETGKPRNKGCRPDAGSFEFDINTCGPVLPADCTDSGPFPVPVFTGPYRGEDFLVWENDCEFEGAFEREGWDDWEGEFGDGIPEGEGVDPFPYEGDWEDNLVDGEFDDPPYHAGEQTYMRTLVSLVLGQWVGRFQYGGGGDYDTPAPDLNHDAKLSRTEAFASIAYLQEHPIIAREFPMLSGYRSAIFDTFDLDGNDYIRTAELNYWVTRLGFNPVMHSADADGDFRFELSELLRIVQFFNVGGIGCGDLNNFADDGYQASAAVPSTDWCLSSFMSAHSSDYNGDNRISLPEMLRAIQLYNGRYLMNANSAPCTGTEDYFCDPGFWTDRNVYYYLPRPGRSIDQLP